MMRRLIALLMLLALLPCAAAETAAAPTVMELHQMMIGCADGYLIRLGDLTIMIDGGNYNPDRPTERVQQYLRDAGVDTLDVHIITHWHLDHCMNLNLIMAEFGTADTVVYGPSAELHEDYVPLANGSYRQMKQHDVIQLANSRGEEITLTCIGPRKLKQDGRCNADSLNFLLQYGTRKVLFTGDHAASIEINEDYTELCRNVDILKFPHHALKPFEIGARAVRVVNPYFVLVPGNLEKKEIWQYVCRRLKMGNIYTNKDGHVVALTNGADYIELRWEINPADYAPGGQHAVAWN